LSAGFKFRKATVQHQNLYPELDDLRSRHDLPLQTAEVCVKVANVFFKSSNAPFQQLQHVFG
jgi:hypothetical protein